MDHHRTSSIVDRYAWLLAVLAPTVATVVDVLALVLVVESDRTFSDEIGTVLLLAFWLSPAMVALGVNWRHP